MIAAATTRLQYSSSHQRSSGIARVRGDIRHFYEERVFQRSGLKTLNSSTLADFPVLVRTVPSWTTPASIERV